MQGWVGTVPRLRCWPQSACYGTHFLRCTKDVVEALGLGALAAPRFSVKARLRSLSLRAGMGTGAVRRPSVS